MELVLLLLAAGVVWWFVAKRRREGAVHTVHSQNAVERRIFELMHEFPAMTDAQIATLVRDELLNARIHDPKMHSWANEETVARLRRTIFLELARRERDASLSASPEKAPPPEKETRKKSAPKTTPRLPPPKKAAEVVRAKDCPHCSKRVRGDVSKCPHCSGHISRSA